LLGWLSGFSVGTEFFFGLRHNQRRGLRMRWRASKLHRRQSGGGKQQQTKFCHDGLGPPEKFSTKVLGNKVCQQDYSDQQTSVGPDCGGLQRRVRIYF
jgi:hypothetical protein